MKRLLLPCLVAVAGCSSAPQPGSALSPDPRTPSAFVAVAAPSGPLETRRFEDLPVIDGAPQSAAMALAFSRFVASGTWGPEHGTAVYADGPAVVVRHSPEALRSADAVLHAIRSAEGRIATLTVRHVDFAAEDAARFENLSPAEAGLADVFDGEAIRALLAGWTTSKVVASPRLQLFAGQTGAIRIENQVAYIQGYHRLASGGAVAWDPILGSFSDGVSSEFCVIPNGKDSTDVLVSFRIAITGALGDGRDLQHVRFQDRRVETPFVATTRCEGTLVLRPGQAIFAIAPQPPRAGAGSRYVGALIEVHWEK